MRLPHRLHLPVATASISVVGCLQAGHNHPNSSISCFRDQAEPERLSTKRQTTAVTTRPMAKPTNGWYVFGREIKVTVKRKPKIANSRESESLHEAARVFLENVRQRRRNSSRLGRAPPVEILPRWGDKPLSRIASAGSERHDKP